MKTLLIPGFGTKIKYSSNSNFGFSAYDKELKAGHTIIFNWGINKEINRINLPKYLDLYRSEKKLASDSKTLKKLQKLIADTKPSTIICHSMGCYLFACYLQKYQHPEAIEEIIFLSSDCTSKDLEKVENTHPKIHNYFCPWDNALISSIIVNHQHLPNGLYSSKNHHIQNHFWPLWIPINLHDSNKKDKFLKKRITPKGVNENHNF